LNQVLAELRKLRRTRSAATPRTENNLKVVSALETGFLVEKNPVSKAETGLPDQASAVLEAANSETSFQLPGQGEQTTLCDTGRQYWHSVARIGIQVADAQQAFHA